MRNKIFDHFLQFSNLSFIFGMVVTIILIHLRSSNGYEDLLWNWAYFYIPYTIFLIISLILAGVFAYHRRNYFILISQHITKKCITLYKWSVYMLFINIFLSIVLLYAGAGGLLQLPTTSVTGEPDWGTTKFFVNVYLYIVLALEMLLTLLDVMLDAISKLKVKVDLSIKRGDADALLLKEYGNEKHESVTEPKN